MPTVIIEPYVIDLSRLPTMRHSGSTASQPRFRLGDGAATSTVQALGRLVRGGWIQLRSYFGECLGCTAYSVFVVPVPSAWGDRSHNRLRALLIAFSGILSGTDGVNLVLCILQCVANYPTCFLWIRLATHSHLFSTTVHSFASLPSKHGTVPDDVNQRTEFWIFSP